MISGAEPSGGNGSSLTTLSAFANLQGLRGASSQILASVIRGLSVEMSSLKKTSHLASVLSCADILAVSSVLAREEPDGQIEVVLSKGHAALGLYAVLFLEGKIDEGMFLSFSDEESVLEEHPNHEVPGVEFPTGSLGHGLGLMAGRVMGSMLQGGRRTGIVVMSDGECNEGTVWEAVLFAAARKLGGLVVVIDANGFQATGPTSESFGSVRLSEIFHGFGWEGEEINGHSHTELSSSIRRGLNNPTPYFVVANTVKGKGVSWMEGDNNWHYRIPTDAEVRLALEELEILSSS